MLDERIRTRYRSELARLFFGLSRRTARIGERLDRPPVLPVSHPQNATFKNLHFGRRAFVIGNGPSLGTQDISPLKGELLLTMNSFDRHPLCRDLRPVYQFLADPEMNDSSPREEEFLARIADGIGDSPVFVPAWPSMESATFRQWSSAGQLWQVPFVGALSEGPITMFDMCVGLPGVQTVAQFALMTAVYMGCNPIYLLGLDSDWAASPDLDRHFYSEPTLDETQDGTDYFEHWTYQQILEATLIMFKGYSNLWTYCRSRHIEVYNCTAGGLLDVFPRKRLEDVIGDGLHN